ncbi:PhoH family protein [bacterium]|nr:PhoH family protein [bacterium]
MDSGSGVPYVELEGGQGELIFGERDENLRAIENVLDVKLSTRGDRLFIEGQTHDVQMVKKLIEQIAELRDEDYLVNASDIEHAAHILASGRVDNLKEIFLDKILVSSKRRIVAPKSIHQKEYIDAIRRHDIVFGIGPAGTGKTYLAMAMAVSDLLAGTVERIILTRPAVEAGEKLGFLPGDIAEKVNPYLRPLYDALHDMIPFEKARRFLDRGIIEVAPLAFMRGRTLNDSFVILDEAQNTTPEQMKMFLTRLGFNSKAVITGDVTQIDLAIGAKSGLVVIQQILAQVAKIRFVRFDKSDVVRHPLVAEIIHAYENYEAQHPAVIAAANTGARPPLPVSLAPASKSDAAAPVEPPKADDVPVE